MNVKFFALVSAIITVIASIGYGYYLGKDLVNVKFDQKNGDPYLTEEGFAIPVKVLVDNPSKLTIPINKVEYKGILEETGEIITQGNIENIKIEKTNKTWINETVNVKWDKTPETSLQLLSNEHVWVTVKLKIHFGPLEIPYSTRVDVKEPIKDQVPEVAVLEELPTTKGLI